RVRHRGRAGARVAGLVVGARDPAVAAIGEVAGEIDLAAIAGVVVAIGEARGADDAARPGRARRRGARPRRAGLAAGAAVLDVGDEVDLATIAGRIVAIGVARIARADAAGARRAPGHGVGDDAGVAAGAAVARVVLEVLLAA